MLSNSFLFLMRKRERFLFFCVCLFGWCWFLLCLFIVQFSLLNGNTCNRHSSVRLFLTCFIVFFFTYFYIQCKSNYWLLHQFGRWLSIPRWPKWIQGSNGGSCKHCKKCKIASEISTSWDRFISSSTYQWLRTSRYVIKVWISILCPLTLHNDWL